jgi:hypothetical protein
VALRAAPPLTARLAHLVRFRDDKVVLLAAYPSVHHARSAAAELGLSS